MHASLLHLILTDESATDDEWWERVTILRNAKSDMTLPATRAELDRQLAALCKAGLIEVVDGLIEPVYERMPVGPRQGSLFGG